MDLQTIDRCVVDAEWNGRRIDDLTAKCIAHELDPGSGPLHELAETGAIVPGIDIDLSVAEEVIQDLELSSRISWIAALRRYVGGRLLTGPMPYWSELNVK